MARHMMATKALHKLGDISRDEPSLCFVNPINPDDPNSDYTGVWVEGFGFVGIRFLRETTRPLNDEEYEKYNGMTLALGSMVLPPLKIRR